MYLAGMNAKADNPPRRFNTADSPQKTTLNKCLIPPSPIPVWGFGQEELISVDQAKHGLDLRQTAQRVTHSIDGVASPGKGAAIHLRRIPSHNGGFFSFKAPSPISIRNLFNEANN